MTGELSEAMEDATGVHIAGGHERDQAARLIRSLSEVLVAPGHQTLTRFGGRGYPLTTHPIVGAGNPIAPPLEVELVEDATVGWARYGALEESYPGEVFGGLVAAAFDAVMGFAAARVAGVVKARCLTVEFLSPVPTHRPVRYAATAVSGSDRSVKASASLHPDGESTELARASAVFVPVVVESLETSVDRIQAG
jgi:hypothetical protein